MFIIKIKNSLSKHDLWLDIKSSFEFRNIWRQKATHLEGLKCQIITIIIWDLNVLYDKKYSLGIISSIHQKYHLMNLISFLDDFIALRTCGRNLISFFHKCTIFSFRDLFNEFLNIYFNNSLIFILMHETFLISKNLFPIF